MSTADTATTGAGAAPAAGGGTPGDATVAAKHGATGGGPAANGNATADGGAAGLRVEGGAIRDGGLADTTAADPAPVEVLGDGQAAEGAGAAPGARSGAPGIAGSRAAADAGSWWTRAGLRMLGSELGLVFRRPRNLATLAVLALVPVLIGVAVRVAGPGDGGGGPSGIITQVAGNGLFLTFASLFFLVPLLLPIAVAVVAGDSIAGEAHSGTLRYLLTAPAGRTRLLLVKYASVMVFCLAASLVVAVSALITGLLLFPAGPMTLLSGATIPFAEGLLRVLIVVGYVSAGMAALGAVGLAISTLTEAPIGAIAATATLVIVAQVLQVIPQISVIRPYLVTYWWNDFDGALREPIATAEMQQGLLAFAAYVLVFGSIAWARFSGRDVTC